MIPQKRISKSLKWDIEFQGKATPLQQKKRGKSSALLILIDSEYIYILMN